MGTLCSSVEDSFKKDEQKIKLQKELAKRENSSIMVMSIDDGKYLELYSSKDLDIDLIKNQK